LCKLGKQLEQPGTTEENEPGLASNFRGIRSGSIHCSEKEALLDSLKIPVPLIYLRHLARLLIPNERGQSSPLADSNNPPDNNLHSTEGLPWGG
jgi:hypothetical protein